MIDAASGRNLRRTGWVDEWCNRELVKNITTAIPLEVHLDQENENVLCTKNRSTAILCHDNLLGTNLWGCLRFLRR